MGRVLLVTWDGGDNVPPMLCIGQELARRGHQVLVIGHELARICRALGLRLGTAA